MAYSFRQLEDLWKSAGGPAAAAPVMAAIALAESSGNPRAEHHDSDGSVDRGLWQINSSHGYGDASFNPRDNAQEAVAVYHSQGLGAWSTYLSGAYKSHMPRSGQAAPSRPRWGVLSQKNYAGTDQGVDFEGAGPIPALARGRVTDVRTEPILEGGRYPVVAYELQEGPYKGQHVYVMENFTPSVHVGQQLRPGQSLGHAHGKYPFIEVGFGDANGDPVAPLYPNPHSAKPQGEAMWNYIKGLIGGAQIGPSLPGAPAAAANPAGGVPPIDHGTATGQASGDVGQITGGGSGLPLVDTWRANIGGGGIFGLFNDTKDFLKAALWLINPLNWLRLFELMVGGLLMLLGFVGLGVLLIARNQAVQEGADYARLLPGPLGGAGRAVSATGELRRRSGRRVNLAERIPQRVAERAATQQGEREERRTQRSQALAQARASGRRRAQAARTRQRTERFGEVPF